MPGGVGIVTQEQIEETRAANLKDALDLVPGVMVRPRFGAADESQLSIRGSGLRNNFHLRGVNVLIDGFPYGNADGFSDFESLELLATKRIEVFKGANALRFGGNTLGGAINLVTKTGDDAGLVESRHRGRLLRLLQGLSGHRAGVRAVRRLRRPQRHRAGGLSRPLRADAAAHLLHLRLSLRRRHHACASTSASCGTRRTCPGALTREEFDDDPTQADPANVRHAGGAQLRLPARRLHGPDARSPRTRRWSGPPSSTTRTSTTRCPSRSSTTPPMPGAPSSAGSSPRRSSATRNRLTVGPPVLRAPGRST